MVARRFTALAVLSPALIGLVACSSTTAGHGAATTAGGPTDSSVGSGSAGAPSAAPTDVAGLGRLMQRGVASISSAHIAISGTVAGQALQGAGDEALANTKLVALDLTEAMGQIGTIRVRIVDGKTYVGLPAGLNHSGKPWALVTAKSTDPVIKAINSSISTAQQSASLNSAATFITAAKSLKLIGSDSVNGAPANHYSVVVDVTKLPKSYLGKQALIAAGLSSLPVDLWVDSAGRPVKVVERLTVQGTTVSSTVLASRFNVPVHITAPPADQVSTS